MRSFDRPSLILPIILSLSISLSLSHTHTHTQSITHISLDIYNYFKVPDPKSDIERCGQVSRVVWSPVDDQQQAGHLVLGRGPSSRLPSRLRNRKVQLALLPVFTIQIERWRENNSYYS